LSDASLAVWDEFVKWVDDGNSADITTTNPKPAANTKPQVMMRARRRSCTHRNCFKAAERGKD
jgi:hypothetical protein